MGLAVSTFGVTCKGVGFDVFRDAEQRTDEVKRLGNRLRFGFLSPHQLPAPVRPALRMF